MITDLDIASYTDQEIRMGEAFCWVIDTNVLYDINVNAALAEIFLNTSRAEDISDQYPEHSGITVKLFNKNEFLEIFQTSEYFGSILLSNPTVVNLLNHKNGRYVISPDAQFIDYEFVITNRSGLGSGWHEGKEPENNQIAKCYQKCNCGWVPNG